MVDCEIKRKAKFDLLIVILLSTIPAIIYMALESSWRGMNESVTISFWVKFLISSLIVYCLSGLGFTVVMLLRKEKFSQYGLVRKNPVKSILLSILCFLPHFVFLLIANGFHGYIPMSGPIVYDSVISQPLVAKIVCMIIVFAVWGFCEGFTYIYIAQKINVIFSPKNKWLNFGAIFCGLLCVFMHGGISFDIKVIFDAITMFLFVYGILVVKDTQGNAWGSIFSFLFLWNAFPSK